MVMLKYVDAVTIWHIGIYSLIHQSAIGASSLRLHWAPHGLLWEILFGLFFWGQLRGQTLPFKPIIPQEEKRYAPSQMEALAVGV